MRRSSPPASLSTRELVALLSPALGPERSRGVILDAAQDLGLRTKALAWLDDLTWEEGLAILSRLAQGNGALAVAARAAYDQLTKPSILPPHEEVPSDASDSTEAQPGAGPHVSIDRLKSLLAPAIGAETSHQIVTEAAAALELGHEDLTLPEALSVLNRIATSSGLVGVTARFAMVRLPRTLVRRETGVGVRSLHDGDAGT
ncbi:hypothetical protein [Chondromyces crocatus]|nr:hypothetical protein [Chondromyces crocatus]